MRDNPGPWEFGDRATLFTEYLDRVKSRVAPRDFEWYPYDSLSVFAELNALLRRAPATLLDLIANEPVADIGCADGAVSFFLESLGCRVQAFDNPATNYNEMRGVRALKRELGAAVKIHTIDLDSYFTLPEKRYGMAIFLGILYHLKNPYYALETLARSARYCLLSTRVTRFAADGRTELENIPVAYLLDDRESNDDPTNFWIFSNAGLRRILHRAGWTIGAYLVLGSENSGPAALSADARAFCFLESARIGVTGSSLELLDGWHAIEQGGWRWTERCFAAAAASDGHMLRMKLTVPGVLFERLGAITLSAQASGLPLRPETFSQAGEFAYNRELPEPSPGDATTTVRFELDKAIAPSAADRRELGIIVSSLTID